MFNEHLFSRNLFFKVTPIGFITSLASTYSWRMTTLFSFDFEMYTWHVEPRNTASSRSLNAQSGSKLETVNYCCYQIQMSDAYVHVLIAKSSEHLES